MGVTSDHESCQRAKGYKGDSQSTEAEIEGHPKESNYYYYYCFFQSQVMCISTLLNY